MIPAIFLRYAPHLIALAVLVGGVFYVHQRAYNAGQSEIQAKWDAQKAIQELAYQEREKAVAKLENERDLLKYKIEAELQPKLASVSRRADDLANRLRRAYFAQAVLPVPAGTSPVPDGTSGNRSGPDDLDRAIGNVLGACQRDAIRLNAWIEFYSGLRATQSGDLP